VAELPPPPEGILLSHFIVSDDVERSRRFYTEVLGGRVAFPGDPVNVALANSWIVINAGGGPTDDKPTVILETPRDPDRVSSFLNIRVKDIDAVYAEWSASTAAGPPHDPRCLPAGCADPGADIDGRHGRSPHDNEAFVHLFDSDPSPGLNPS
jgi:catechol 2,3-dioxygenase-like lactoylglutathione lyase family enzyme